MTEEAIKDWFIHQFWPVYPGKWCRSGKGGRGEAMNAFLKKKKDMPFQKNTIRKT